MALFERCVFVNCPFDEDYSGLLQAILFCVVYLGLVPRIASESIDSGEVRLEKIRTLIEGSKFSIHDLSRCQSQSAGEFYRLNMPFELGIDYGCRRYFGKGRNTKQFLILEEDEYRYRAALSDLAGCDIQAHDGDAQVAIRKVRNWLVSAKATSVSDAPKKIFGSYADFQGWYYEKQLHAGFSEEDILDYPTSELLAAMQDWFAQGKPVEFTP